MYLGVTQDQSVQLLLQISKLSPQMRLTHASNTPYNVQVIPKTCLDCCHRYKYSAWVFPALRFRPFKRTQNLAVGLSWLVFEQNQYEWSSDQLDAFTDKQPLERVGNPSVFPIEMDNFKDDIPCLFTSWSQA